MPELDYYEERCALAAAFRLAFREGWHEAVANHFSLAVSDDGKTFLINPAGLHFSRIKASDLILCNADGPAPTVGQENAPDSTAWAIHGAFHRHEPRARACLHVHADNATALSCIVGAELPPIDQNTARFFRHYGYDDGYGGMGLGSEGERISKTLGPHRILVMGNHGVMAAAESVARAFDELYYFERACGTYLKAAATGLPLKVLSDDIAEKTARDWEDYPMETWDQHFEAMCAILDQEGSDYRD
ncbi:class II aldolase/adducin family protein [Yoonia maritima]|uniref:class II aldolase/adducin family protein n=1 Tax=Yoonia maritima TaxID=1435347 RepID=UPI0037356A07